MNLFEIARHGTCARHISDVRGWISLHHQNLNTYRSLIPITTQLSTVKPDTWSTNSYKLEATITETLREVQSFKTISQTSKMPSPKYLLKITAFTTLPWSLSVYWNPPFYHPIRNRYKKRSKKDSNKNAKALKLHSVNLFSLLSFHRFF